MSRMEWQKQNIEITEKDKVEIKDLLKPIFNIRTKGMKKEARIMHHNINHVTPIHDWCEFCLVDWNLALGVSKVTKTNRLTRQANKERMRK